MSALRLSIFLIFLFAACAAYPIEREFPCSPAKQEMGKLLHSGYAYTATATEQHGFVVQLYYNTHDSTWKILAIDNNLSACTMLQGFEWQFALVRSM